MFQRINDLPELALIRVFKLLPFFDQLNARLVCKKWKAFIEQDILGISRTQLILLLRVAERPLRWSHSHRPVDADSSIAVKVDKILDSPFFNSLFGGIKELFISLYNFHFIALKQLALLFPHLEHFEISNPYFAFYQEIKPVQLDLKLPQLKTLYLDCKIELIDLNCPALNALSMIGDLNLVKKFSDFSDSLRFLKVRSFTHQPDCALPSLQVLCFSRNLQIHLPAFKKLKEIHYFHARNYEFLEGEPPQDAKEILASLFERKRRLDRELDLYHCGIKCKSLEEVESRKHCFGRDIIWKDELDCILKGSDELKLENVKKKLLYDEVLFDEYKDRLNGEAIKKLASSIEHLSIGNDSSEPLETVQKLFSGLPLEPKVKLLLKYIKYANVRPLPQHVLDEMPALMPSLLRLRSIDGYQLECKTLNFSFLSRFKGLQDLEVDKDWLSVDLLAKIIENCKFLRKVIILENDKAVMDSITIWRFMETEFQIWFRNFPVPEVVYLLSWTEVLDYLDRNNLIKSHSFCGFFSQNYYPCDLNPIDYFHTQSH